MAMSKSQVEVVLGAPPGDYTTGSYNEPPMGGVFYALSTKWIYDDGMILVWFDENDRVNEAAFCEIKTYDRPTILDRICKKLGIK